MESTDALLVGNSFPFSLVRRPVQIVPRTFQEWEVAAGTAAEVLSFWGHSNTLAEANAWAGVDLTPRVARPALTLDGDGFPCLDELRFGRVWVLSPNLAPGFRTGEGTILPADAILGWQALEILWE